MNKEDCKRIERELAEQGITVKITLMETRTKRLVRYMTDPGRIVFGILAALFVCALNSNWHLHQGGFTGFWFIYLWWFPAMFVTFWLWELRAWAGGRNHNM